MATRIRLAYFNQPYFWLLPIKIAEGVKSKVIGAGWSNELVVHGSLLAQIFIKTKQVAKSESANEAVVALTHTHSA